MRLSPPPRQSGTVGGIAIIMRRNLFCSKPNSVRSTYWMQSLLLLEYANIFVYPLGHVSYVCLSFNIKVRQISYVVSNYPACPDDNHKTHSWPKWLAVYSGLPQDKHHMNKTIQITQYISITQTFGNLYLNQLSRTIGSFLGQFEIKFNLYIQKVNCVC